MEETQKTTEQNQHETNKFIREKLAWIHYRMESIQFYLSEAQLALETRGVLAAICLDLQKKIEEVEPPVKEDAKEETKKPYIMDVPVKAEALEAVQ